MKAKDLLIPFGKLYGAITDARNYLYENGHFKSISLGSRTISIGNLTTGGTGKTPLTALVAEILADAGKKVCILSRGYGRSTKSRIIVSDFDRILANVNQGGDEPFELAKKLLGKAIVIADADRVAAAAWAKQNFDLTAFVLDDGFQHRRAKRDLNFLCIDTTDPWGNGRLLPAGKLRENIKNLTRADVFILTRTDQTSNQQILKEIEQKIRKYKKDPLIFHSKTTIKKLSHLDEMLTHNSDQKALFAFSGIGNPAAFEKDLHNFAKQTGEIDLLGSLSFGDHHEYSQNDIIAVEKAAAKVNANGLVTTAKDAVKLTELSFSMTCYVAEIETIIDDPAKFREVVLGS